MIHRAVLIFRVAAWCAAPHLFAQDTITWNSDAGATNLTSAGLPMDSAYRFELGVFTASFVPTTANLTDWAAHWNAAKRCAYDPATRRFSGSFVVSDNTVPFTLGKPAYVWGFRGDALGGEWILFRAASWSWPDGNGFVPSFSEWFAKDAAAVLGTIHAGGSPFLMKSAAVTQAAPPATWWAQWQADNLTGEALNGPGDDPDHDGMTNLWEFVFGTPPKSAGASVSTPVEVVDAHLQITVPRRIDHPVDLTVEVSADLTTWFSGPAYTEVVDDGPAALVVRDLTAPDAVHPKRFIRVKAELPAP